METVRSNTGAGNLPCKHVREGDIGKLREGIGIPCPVMVPCREIVPVNPVNVLMGARGDRDNPCGRTLPEQRQEQAGQQEGGEIIDRKGQFDPLPRKPPVLLVRTGIVDEDIEGGITGGEVCCHLPDLVHVGEVRSKGIRSFAPGPPGKLPLSDLHLLFALAMDDHSSPPAGEEFGSRRLPDTIRGTGDQNDRLCHAESLGGGRG